MRNSRNGLSLAAIFIRQAMRLLALGGLAVLLPAAFYSKGGHDFLQQGNDAFERGRFADAVTAYTRALDQSPENPKAFYDRALANEMVDRQSAIRDWRRFIDSTDSDPGWKSEVTRVRERLRSLEAEPALPEVLHPGRYVPRSGDYYDDVAQDSAAGLEWNQFPVKVFEDSPPKEWQQAAQEALDGWLEIFPLQ